MRMYLTARKINKNEVPPIDCIYLKKLTTKIFIDWDSSYIMQDDELYQFIGRGISINDTYGNRRISEIEGSIIGEIVYQEDDLENGLKNIQILFVDDKEKYNLTSDLLAG